MNLSSPPVRKSVRRLVTLTFAVASAQFVFGAVYVEQLLARGFQPESIGLAFAAALAVSTVFEVFSGDWGDRHGQRLMTVLGLGLWGAGLIAFALVRTLPGLIAALICWSIGQAVYSGAPLSLTVNAIPADDPASRAAAVRFSQVARWCGAALGGLFVLAGGQLSIYPVLIIGGGIALLVSAGAVQMRWPESRTDGTRTKGRLGSRLLGGWQPRLGSLVPVLVVNMGLLSVFLLAWQPLTSTVLGLSPTWLGLVLLVLMAAAAGGAWAAKLTVSQLQQRDADLWIVSAVVGVAVCMLALSGVALCIGFIVIEFSSAYVMASASTRVHAIVSDGARNLVWSAISATMGLAAAGVDLVFGIAWGDGQIVSGLVWGVAAAALVGGVVGLAGMVLTRRTDPTRLAVVDR